MYQKSLIPTLPLLNRKIVIKSQMDLEIAYVQAVSDEHLEVLINPGEADEEYYAELYFEDYGSDAWELVEILD